MKVLAPTEFPSGEMMMRRVLPESWSFQRLSWLFEVISSGTTPPTEDSEFYNGEIPWVTTGELRESTIHSTSKNVTCEALARHSALQLYPIGALVIAMYGATIGRLGILGTPATTNQACCVLAGPRGVVPKYVFYVLLSAREHLVQLASGGGQPNINQDKVRALRIGVPPLGIQARIVQYLDRETAKIDELIAKQKRLIELLAEKRQAIITQAVTKGLDPTAPTKPSGVHWLGEVPASWTVSAFKREWTVVDCKHVTAEFVDDGVPLASIREVQGKFVNLDRAKSTTMAFYRSMIEGNREPRFGDLIFSRNATVGEVAIVPRTHEPFAMGQDVCMLKRQSAETSPEFAWYAIRSRYVQEQISLAMIGSTFKRINVEEIRSLSYCVPPPEEQHAIARHLDERVSVINMAMSAAAATVELLRERRSALISAAVTGMIDVRKEAS